MGSTVGQLATVKFKPAQHDLIQAVELHVAQATSSGPCTILAVTRPTKPLKTYRDMTRHFPSAKLSSTQAHVRAAILGGNKPGRGVVMMDSGAALSIITE